MKLDVKKVLQEVNENQNIGTYQLFRMKGQTMEENEEILSEEELMHEMQEWQEDYAETQAEWYTDNM